MVYLVLSQRRINITEKNMDFEVGVLSYFNDVWVLTNLKTKLIKYAGY